jgi:hypothetical protein
LSTRIGADTGHAARREDGHPVPAERRLGNSRLIALAREENLVALALQDGAAYHLSVCRIPAELIFNALTRRASTRWPLLRSRHA